MWDQRYDRDEYLFGMEPNGFLHENSHLLAGPVLSLGEGEGRNAVYLAGLGLDVLGVDASAVGLAKARQLATARNVAIRTDVVDLEEYVPPEETFGAVVSIFAHLPSQARKRLHAAVERSLKPGGIVLLEWYGQQQLARNTGGPRNIDMLVTGAMIEQDFPNCEVVLVREVDREVREGVAHTGMASVVQYIGRRKPPTGYREAPPARGS